MHFTKLTLTGERHNFIFVTFSIFSPNFVKNDRGGVTAALHVLPDFSKRVSSPEASAPQVFGGFDAME